MTTLLVAGFGRFPGAPFNPTAVIVRRLGARRRPAFAAVRIISHVFTTRYAAVDRDLAALIARERPDAVVLFGVARRAKTVRLELIARNRVSVLFPDAGGHRPDSLAIARRGPSRKPGRFPAAPLLAALRTVAPDAALSRDAGSYLCNYAYWRALENEGAAHRPRLVVFVHVPPVPLGRRPRGRCGTAAELPRTAVRPRRRRATLSDHVRSADALLCGIAVALRDNARSSSGTMR